MGNDSSKRKFSRPLEISRVGDPSATVVDQTAPPSAKPPKNTVLSSGETLSPTNAVARFQQLSNERRVPSVEPDKPKKKAKAKAKDYTLCLEYMCSELVTVLKDPELREGVFDLDAHAFEALIRNEVLVVPDEAYVLCLVGAWAERRADAELTPKVVDDGVTETKETKETKVDLRGSDGLYQALGEGAARLLVPPTPTSKTSEEDSEQSKKAEEPCEGGEDKKEDGDDGGEDKQKEKEKEENEKEVKEEKETKEKDGLTDSQLAEVNLRGTAGLYASFASAYTNMISDEDMAQKLQEQEEEEEKIRRKLMEEEDEKLARALQQGELDDGGTLPATVTQTEEAKEEEEDLEPIPEHKLQPEYLERIRHHMEPFLQYIRYGMLPVAVLEMLAREQLVPKKYLAEAYRFLALNAAGMPESIEKDNIRYMRRKYLSTVVWDQTWHGQNIQISSDGKNAVKTQASWYSIACAKEGYKNGRHSWAIKVDGDEAYIGITQKGNPSLDNYLGVNAQSWAFRTSYKYSTAHGNGYYGETFGRGDVIGVMLDMDAATVTFFKNGKNLGVCFIGIPTAEPIYPAVGWRAGNMTLVSLDSSLE